MDNRSDQIHEKGFDINSHSLTEYGKIKVGTKTLQDAILNLGDLSKNGSLQPFYNKKMVLKALMTKDVKEQRAISNHFYEVSGIYQRMCEYFAFLYRYDWYVATCLHDKNKFNADKISKDFDRILNFLDNSYIKEWCGNTALKVLKNGCYYGYIVPSGTGLVIQELPIDYCRTRYEIAGKPAVEFNMKYFDRYSDTAYR